MFGGVELDRDSVIEVELLCVLICVVWVFDFDGVVVFIVGEVWYLIILEIVCVCFFIMMVVVVGVDGVLGGEFGLLCVE